MDIFTRGNKAEIVSDFPVYYNGLSHCNETVSADFPFKKGDVVTIKDVGRNIVIEDSNGVGWPISHECLSLIKDNDEIPQGDLKDGDMVRVIVDEPTYFDGGIRRLHTAHEALDMLHRGAIVTIEGEIEDGDDDYQIGNYLINDEWLISKDNVEKVTVVTNSEYDTLIKGNADHDPKDDRPEATAEDYKTMASLSEKIHQTEWFISELGEKIEEHKKTIESCKEFMDNLRTNVRF